MYSTVRNVHHFLHQFLKINDGCLGLSMKNNCENFFLWRNKKISLILKKSVHILSDENKN
jgi:hypothetical protein